MLLVAPQFVLCLLVVPVVLVAQLLLGGQLLETLVVVLLLVPDFDLVEALVLQGGPELRAVLLTLLPSPSRMKNCDPSCLIVHCTHSLVVIGPTEWDSFPIFNEFEVNIFLV